MIFCIPAVLAPDVLGKVQAALASAPFIDGRATASDHARLVKKNLQLDESEEVHAELSKLVTEAVLDNALFQLAVLPKSLQPFRFSRYETGMGYGPYGSVGIGEDVATVVPVLIGPAIHNATGKWVEGFPVTPDKVLKALGKA